MADTYGSKTVIQLRQELRDRKLPVSGLKSQLIARLREHDQTRSDHEPHLNILSVAPDPSAPLYRHQRSLQTVIDFVPKQQLSQSQRDQATYFMNELCNMYGMSQLVGNEPFKSYKPAALVTALLQYNPSTQSQDEIFKTLLPFLHEQLTETEDPSPNPRPSFDHTLIYLNASLGNKDDLCRALESFSAFMIHNFFLPIRARGGKTEQPTPILLQADQSESNVGTTSRLSSLRKKCLYRDHHRCVISRLFDRTEARVRAKQNDGVVFDDDGIQIQKFIEMDNLEIAHIIPHSLMSRASTDDNLSEIRQNACKIWKMFDIDAIHLLEGSGIDSPQNALTLTHSCHLSEPPKRV
ncbi:hypothetical protein N7495_004420 [Penicillium taxi]|uniref:uncharacterized protein n=1 Tax=Penicillium taxi TaxID=168475 RepID=UPI00254541DE|nr:uncharacterized protein N7495_004420 [Penicillium taxi]KAJ5899676.1 hypothetical protein N7495_004420 [Penicillium taxi]